MYEQFFGFNSRPFISTPHVQSYFPGESIHHALTHARMCIERASGPVVVTGSSGSGKSLLIAMLTAHFKNNYSVVTVVCGNMRERRDLLQSILFELNQPYKDMSEGELRLSLIDYLKTDEVNQSGMLVLIDDAHNLPVDLLDELRVITNLVRDGRPMVSLVMVGQPSLEDHLIETKSESLSQRIAGRCYLNSLTQNETFEYISTHIERAGGNGDHLFTGDALKSVHKSSGGIPRIINQICDYALVLAASQGSQRVTADIVNDAWLDVQSIPGSVAPIETFEQRVYTEAESVVANEPMTTYETEMSHESPGEEPVATDDSLMVIEFGQLNDEEGVTTGVDQLVEISALDDGDAVESLESQTIEIGSGFDESSAAGLAAMGIADSTYSGIIDQGGDDRVKGYPDPFGVESFKDEEIVKASFIPEVSEQNLNSLMLSNEQLRVLEKVDTDYSPMEKGVAGIAVAAPSDTESEVAAAVESIIANHKDEAAMVEEEIAPDNAIEDEAVRETSMRDDLRLSSGGLASLEQIANDIKQLQRDMQFSEQQFHSQAVHPDYQTVSADQSIEELMQDFSTAEITDVNDLTEQTTIPMPQVVESSGLEDDQDMIVSQPHRVERFATEEPLEESDDEVTVSTGNAERMDYVDLFQQLRSG